jgi:hypothetical protein
MMMTLLNIHIKVQPGVLLHQERKHKPIGICFSPAQEIAL